MIRLSLIAGIVALVFSSASYAQSDECSTALQKYQNQSYSELLSLEKIKKTKMENKVYLQVKKEEELIKKHKEDSASFIKNIDEFSQDKTFKTQTTNTNPRIIKAFCKNSKLVNGVIFEPSNRVFIRKICIGPKCSDPQIYIVQNEESWSKIPLSYNFTGYYTKINRAVIKEIGDVKYNAIDFDISTGRYSEYLGLQTFNVAHHGVSIQKEYLTKLYQNQKDIELRIYSTEGVNFDVSVPFAHVKAFVEGMNSEGAW